MEKPKVFISKRDAKVYDVRRPTPVEIVCGDCSVRADAAGDAELLPYRTFLAMDGRCYTCGGGSFVIASELCGALRRTITERRRFGISAPFAIASELSETNSRELWAVGPNRESLGVAATRSQVEADSAPQIAARVN